MNSGTENMRKEASSSIIRNLLASISSLSKTGCSLLFNKSASELSNYEQFFQSVLLEIKVNVPFLYELLDALTGTVGCKSATICTIYGMIMHSRNMQASAIQRLWTTAAIKCHADNKVNRFFFNQLIMKLYTYQEVNKIFSKMLNIYKIVINFQF